MDLKITSVARRELDRLDSGTRAHVLKGIRELPSGWQRDKVLHLSGIEDNVRMHKLTGSFRVLYRVTDVDDDGDDELVVLQLVDKRLAEPIVATRLPLTQSSTESVRLGSQLASEMLTTD